MSNPSAYGNTPDNPQLIQTAWNRRAIVSFIIPFVTFLVVQVFGRLVNGTASMKSSTAITRAELDQVISATWPVLIVAFVGYLVAVILAHVALTKRYRPLRGRGFAIAGLVLGYLGIGVTILGAVTVAVLPMILENGGYITG